MSDRALLELANMSGTLADVLREAYGLAQSGDFGGPLREALHFARDLVSLADETLATDPQAGEHARGIALHMAEQLAAVEALLGPIADNSAMAGPLHAPAILVLYPFRFRDPVSGKWVRARYVAERHELEARYAEWEIIGEPEYRRLSGGAFSPWK